MFSSSKIRNSAMFSIFKAETEKQTGLSIKGLRHDRGGEYTSNVFKALCLQSGIIQELTEAYSPQQNGVAERANRTLVEMARSMLYHHHLPLPFWAEAIRTAAYIRNRCPTSRLGTVTPEEAWTGHKPSVSHLRTFGCVGYCHVADVNRRKLEAKSRPCVFTGYEASAGTCSLIDPAANFRLW